MFLKLIIMLISNIAQLHNLTSRMSYMVTNMPIHIKVEQT